MSYSWRGSRSESLHSSSFQLEDSSKSINMMEDALPAAQLAWDVKDFPWRGQPGRREVHFCLATVCVERLSVLVWWSWAFFFPISSGGESIMAPLCSVTGLWKPQCHQTWSSEPREICSSCYPWHISQQDILLPADAQGFVVGADNSQKPCCIWRAANRILGALESHCWQRGQFIYSLSVRC